MRKRKLIYLGKRILEQVVVMVVENLPLQIAKEREKMKNRGNPPAATTVNLPELLARVDNDRELLCDLISIFKEEFLVLSSFI